PPEVRRARGGVRAPGRGERSAGCAAPRRDVQARAAVPPAGAGRGGLLRDPAIHRRARAARVPAGRGRRAGRARGRGLARRPAALFIGVLEHYKDIDGLAAAWRLAAPRVPGVALHLVGKGTRAYVVEALLRDLPEQTRWTPELSTREVAEALDGATLLVLPSR